MKFLKILVGGLAMTIFCGACGKKDEVKDEDKTIEQPIDHAKVESKCDGNRVPPTNYRQETAFVSLDTPNASDEAARVATERLRDKICQGYRCSAIETKISIWNTETDQTQVCAMAVVKGQDIAAFLETPRKKLDEGMKKRGGKLVSIVKKKSKRDSPRIAIDTVTDNGVEGGARAEWLVDKIAAAIGNAGGDTVKLPKKWSGLNLPKDVDGVVTGRVTRLHGQESMLEVVWKVDMGKSTRSTDGISFPELIGPVIDPSTFLPELPGTDEISLNFDSRPGGGMCPGDRGEMVLETGRPLLTRIINLYGDGSEGIVIFAHDEKLKAKQPTTLFDFEVVRATEVPVERFLVFGAESKGDFGEFANVEIPCRLPKETAKRLSSGLGYPKGGEKYRAVRSYRILGQDDCGPGPDQTSNLDSLNNLKMCW